MEFPWGLVSLVTGKIRGMYSVDAVKELVALIEEICRAARSGNEQELAVLAERVRSIAR